MIAIITGTTGCSKQSLYKCTFQHFLKFLAFLGAKRLLKSHEICYFRHNTVPLHNMLPCGKNQCQCQCKNSGRRILFLSWEPCSAGAGYYSAAARSHAADSCWCWITFRRSHEIPCLNTHENDSSEESFEAIKLAVMPIFGILKHLFEVCKTFSAHNNPSSHSGISDTFVLYIYTIYFIN